MLCLLALHDNEDGNSHDHLLSILIFIHCCVFFSVLHMLCLIVVYMLMFYVFFDFLLLLFIHSSTFLSLMHTHLCITINAKTKRLFNRCNKVNIDSLKTIFHFYGQCLWLQQILFLQIIGTIC